MGVFVVPSQRRVSAAWVATFVVLLASAGCKPAQPGWPRLAPQPTPPGRWTETVIENGWITVNLGLPHHGPPPYPVVLNPIVPDHALLARGIGVVRWKTNWQALKGFAAPKPAESAPPSEQVGVWMLRSAHPGVIGRGYFGVITTEAHDTIPDVVDHLLTHPDVDPVRVAITGSSTGGFTALQALAEDPRLALGVVQVACGDYRLFLRSSSLALDDQERWLVDGEMILDPDYAATLDGIEPVARADHLPPRPILLISGAQDRAIPAACVRATAERFATTYDDAGVPDRFEWVEYVDRGHNLGPEAEQLILSFLERWLEVGPRLVGSP